MVVLHPCRPPAPSAAERARGIAARGGPAALVGTGVAPTRPLVHHVWADGSAALLLPDDDPLLARLPTTGIAAEDGCAAMLEISDPAPVDLRERVRGLLWITGTVTRAVDPRRLAAAVADARPDPALLDLGYGASMVRLAPDSVVVSDGDGTAALTPVALAAARPDPFHHYELQWLPHLERCHPSSLAALRHHLPSALRGGRVRPLGIDRHGLRLRVEAEVGDHDVRLAWPREVRTPHDLASAMAALAGCPVAAAVRSTGASEG